MCGACLRLEIVLTVAAPSCSRTSLLPTSHLLCVEIDRRLAFHCVVSIATQYTVICAKFTE